MQIAEGMGITRAAVSKYLNQVLENTSLTSMISDPISRMALEIASGSSRSDILVR